MRISKKVSTLVLVATLATATPVLAANVMVGGQEMFPSKNIVQNAVNSADHTTLVAAVKAAGLVDTLQSPGPFTVFAPVNSAFAALPAGTVDTLLMPENKAQLAKILTYHVVPERLTFDDLSRRVMDGKGTTTLKTAAGETLVAMMNGPNNIAIKDANGGVANVAIYDVMQSNGVIHSIDKVLLPK
jgi:uncharacterized surface protein with fasciclin (FAS1) repeats